MRDINDGCKRIDPVSLTVNGLSVTIFDPYYKGIISFLLLLSLISVGFQKSVRL